MTRCFLLALGLLGCRSPDEPASHTGDSGCPSAPVGGTSTDPTTSTGSPYASDEDIDQIADQQWFLDAVWDGHRMRGVGWFGGPWMVLHSDGTAEVHLPCNSSLHHFNTWSLEGTSFEATGFNVYTTSGCGAFEESVEKASFRRLLDASAIAVDAEFLRVFDLEGTELLRFRSTPSLLGGWTVGSHPDAAAPELDALADAAVYVSFELDAAVALGACGGSVAQGSATQSGPSLGIALGPTDFSSCADPAHSAAAEAVVDLLGSTERVEFTAGQTRRLELLNASGNGLLALTRYE